MVDYDCTRRGFLRAAGLGTAAFALSASLRAARAASAPKRPNILYIMSDDHAAHAISAYGSRLAKVAPTPNIDRLANEGILFEYWMHMAHHDNPAHFGVRTKQYKLIFFYGQNYRTRGPEPTRPGWKLYDMKNDPHEMNNLYGKRRYAGVVKELKAELLRLRKKYNETEEEYPHIQKVIDEYWNKYGAAD